MENVRKILVDVGSSTVKAYLHSEDGLEPLVQKSVAFNDGFDPDRGISDHSQDELLELMKTIEEQNEDVPIEIYATGIFRKMSAEALEELSNKFAAGTGLTFNVVSHDLENSYLEMALIGKCSLDEPVLLINIGGGSTELVVMDGEEAIERKNIDLGVGSVITKFPGINSPLSAVGLRKVIECIDGFLPSLSNGVRTAFYTGGELNYMTLAKYPLQKNDLFEDEDHPVLIRTTGMAERNVEIFEKVELQELESLMPENPKWMHGARGCSAIAQAICEKYGITTVIPSDSNMINGVVRKGRS